MHEATFGANQVFTAALKLWRDAWLPLTGVGFLANLAIATLLYPLGPQSGFALVLEFGLGTLVSATILLLAADALGGGPYRLQAHIQRVLSIAGPIFALNLTAVILMAFGFILLLVPGIYAAAMFLALMPVLVLEGAGWSSLRRSVELARPHSMGVIGLVLWLVGLFALILVPLFAVSGALFAEGGFDILNLGLSLFVASMLEAVMACATLLTYYRLLELSGGGGGSNVERVFE